nr:hypothetical protein [Streptococcus lutetiensis]
MLKIFKFDREVYSGAEIRERVDYYENESNRISELSKSNVKLAISDLKALKDEIEAEHHYFDKLLFQTIVTSFEDDNALVVNTYIEFISNIATHLHDTNNSKHLSDNIDEFRHALAYTDIKDLLDNEKTYGHHQAANVGRDLRAIGSGSQEYAFLSRTHAFLINPSNKSYKEMLKVWERTDGSLFDNETLKGYINKKLMNRFK